MLLAFCDLETTGLSREKHEIIQIAGLIWDSKTDEIVGTFNEYIKPNARIPNIITEITGISNVTVQNARKSWDVLPDFFAWYKSYNCDYIIGHNFKSFDAKFLEAQCARYGLFEKGIIMPPIIDTLQIARALKKAGKITTINEKQATLAEYFGIKYNAHNAIDDVECLVRIYRKMRMLDPKLI